MRLDLLALSGGWQKRRRNRSGDYKLLLDPYARAARNTTSIAQQLRALRGDLSRAEFASQVGVDESMVMHVETRKMRPSTAYLTAVAARAGRPVQEVFVIDPEPLRLAQELLAHRQVANHPEPQAEPPVEADPALVAALDRCIGRTEVTILAPPHPLGRHLVLIPGREPETAPTLDAALALVGPKPQPWEDLLRGVLASLFHAPHVPLGGWRATVQAMPASVFGCDLALAAPPKKFCGRGETAGQALALGIAALGGFGG